MAEPRRLLGATPSTRAERVNPAPPRCRRAEGLQHAQRRFFRRSLGIALLLRPLALLGRLAVEADAGEALEVARLHAAPADDGCRPRLGAAAGAGPVAPV